MTVLHITRGLPSSGKSTFAREWVSENPTSRVRINRDDVRAMIHKQHAGHPTESATTSVCHAAVRSLLRAGRDVICDDTNLNASHVKRLISIAQQCGADVEWHDFPTTPEEAKIRDYRRGSTVGPAVIDRFARYLVAGELPPRPQINPAPTFAPYEAASGTVRAVIVDIDGTLAHNDGHRSFYDYSKVSGDSVHGPVLALLWTLIDSGDMPVIMSGRDDSCRDATIAWLSDRCGLNEGDYVGPLMRTTGDKRDDVVVKLEMFDRYVRDQFDVRYVLDDRDRVVRAWRSIGLTVLQVAEGDF